LSNQMSITANPKKLIVVSKHNWFSKKIELSNFDWEKRLLNMFKILKKLL